MTTEKDVASQPDKRKRFFLIWAITSTVAALVFANLALVLFVRLRSVPDEAPPFPARAESSPGAAARPSRMRNGSFPEEGTQAYPTLGAPLTRPLNSSFTNLLESDVAGRYRSFKESGSAGIITLLPDHTFLNKEGITIPQYRWAIQSDGILTTWRNSSILFNDIEKPGVYVARRNDGVEYSRIEKMHE